MLFKLGGYIARGGTYLGTYLGFNPTHTISYASEAIPGFHTATYLGILNYCFSASLGPCTARIPGISMPSFQSFLRGYARQRFTPRIQVGRGRFRRPPLAASAARGPGIPSIYSGLQAPSDSSPSCSKQSILF